MVFTLDLDVAAAPAEVFAFVADFATTPRWYSAVQRVEPLSGAGGVGTRYAVHRRLPTGPVVNVVAVTSFVTDHEVAFESIDGPTPFSYRYRVAPAPNGTRLELEGAISAAGLPGPARLLGPLAEPILRRGMQDNLRILKQLLENR